MRFTGDLRDVFLFIAACKVAVIIVTLFWVRDARSTPRPAPDHTRRGGMLQRLNLAMFRSRAFLVLIIATFSVNLVTGGTGVFRTFFPVQGANAAGLDTAQVGTLIMFSGILALGAAIPAGIANDRIGRKRTLIFALLATSLTVWMMSGLSDFESALLAVLAFGLAEAFATGTNQVYAMDLAPDDRRGAFLGVWSLSMIAGQVIGPIVIGSVADNAGLPDGLHHRVRLPCRRRLHRHRLRRRDPPLASAGRHPTAVEGCAAIMGGPPAGVAQW